MESVSPQSCGGAVTSGFAEFCKMVLVASISRTKCGRADQSKATTPATCGEAIDVPWLFPKLLSLPKVLERTATPGAERLGLSKFGV